jgi:23S rRNA maturation-related 3'-5' exoribonuclease YhaM
LSLTLLAALLHDLAKVGDYYRLAPNVYSTNMNCELLGHEQTMLKWIAVACAVSGCYPSERELALEHAICAVRKQHDQAGARKRKTPESFVLHKADCASARAFDLGQPSVLLTQHFVCGE